MINTLVFMELMQRYFSPYVDKFVVVFIDDVVMHSKEQKTHEENLRVVLEKLRNEKLYWTLRTHQHQTWELVDLE